MNKSLQINIKKLKKLGMIAHISNPGTQEAIIENWVLRPAGTIYETSSQKNWGWVGEKRSSV